jgi:amidophosphoribosyltransferase
MRVEDKLHEECAVFGVSLFDEEAAGVVYNGLLSLQHRGQEGAGIAVVHGNDITCHKGLGLVGEVFSKQAIEMLPVSRLAVGHTRYSTTGSSTAENVGPFVTEYLTGRIATAHNGNITNAAGLRSVLEGNGLRFRASSDSEVVSSLIAYHTTLEGDIYAGIAKAASRMRGSYSLVIATSDGKLIGVRDPEGFRPLCIGQGEAGMALASESCALDTCGFSLVRDVQPGEMVVIDNGVLTTQGPHVQADAKRHGLCIFEYVYLARPDSVIDGLSVYEARYNMGAALARECPADADIVCGVPDSGLEAASGYSAASGLPLVAGFMRNRYIGRSFIYPTQSQRDSAVRLKLNPLTANVAGKRIVLVDDSIVRGTTSEKIVRSLKRAGAKEVHLRISSPPILRTCHYGTDIADEASLIANKMSIDAYCQDINADSLGYISIEGLKAACGKCTQTFCSVCFADTGRLHTGDA